MTLKQLELHGNLIDLPETGLETGNNWEGVDSETVGAAINSLQLDADTAFADALKRERDFEKASSKRFIDTQDAISLI